MKKLYTIASTLLLVLGMMMMSACSSENDPVTDEQPILPEQTAETTHTVTLKTTVKMGEDTRVAVDPIDGKDAFNITGWKDGDELVAYYLHKKKSSYHLGVVIFTYDELVGDFTAQVNEDILLSDFKYIHNGPLFEGASYKVSGDQYIIKNYLTSVMTPESIFLCGEITTDGKSLRAELSAPYALACVHNNSEEPLEVVPCSETYSDNKYACFQRAIFDPLLELPDAIFFYEYTTNSEYTSVFYNQNRVLYNEIKRPITIPTGQKVYIPLPSKYGAFGLMNVNTGKLIAPIKQLTDGKVYKVVYEGGESGEGGNVPDTDPLNGHEYVDLGVVVNGKPVYWANTNIGAELPADVGLYFAWGETLGYKADASDGHSFDWEHYSSELCGGKYYNLLKYCTYQEFGSVDNKTELDPEDDAAHINWQGVWRMPNKDEILALCDQCTWTWTEMTNSKGDQIGGYKISNNNDSSKFIFLPYTGWRAYDSIENDESGIYWSSSLYTADRDDTSAFFLHFVEGKYIRYHNSRSNGCPIRPVWLGDDIYR